MPPLGRWLLSFGVPSLLAIATTYAVLRLLFRSELRGNIEASQGDEKNSELTVHGRIILFGLLFVIMVLLTASAFGKDLGLPTCLAALAVTAVVSVKAKENPVGFAKAISWETLLLVAGLFVMVDAIESLHALAFTTGLLHRAEQLGSAAAALVVGFALGVANNLVNNLPLGLIAGGTLQAAHATGLLANAVLIGVDLGPNLSVTGSLATILWLMALRKSDINVTFWRFLKVGAVVMPTALLAAIGGSILIETVTK